MRVEPYQRKFQVPPRQLSLNCPEPDWNMHIRHLIQLRYSKAGIALALGITREKLYSVLKGIYTPTWREGQLILQWIEREHNKPSQDTDSM